MDKNICDNIYGVGLEVCCPACEFGTWIGDVSKKHECAHCGAEFSLDEASQEQHKQIIKAWRSL